MQTTVNTVLSTFLAGHLVTARVLSNASFDVQANALMGNFKTQVMAAKASVTGQILMLLVRPSGIYSAVNTNAFQMSVPGSDQYQVVNNFYPLHDNASFSH
ncbi:unnamed protein product, partial [Rotaria sp. Silwood2]